MAVQMQALDEWNRERSRQAEQFFHPQMVKHWREMAKDDAEKNLHEPSFPDLVALATHLYTMAWAKRRYELSRAKRDGDIDGGR